jgi:hypothetical protein
MLLHCRQPAISTQGSAQKLFLRFELDLGSSAVVTEASTTL